MKGNCTQPVAAPAPPVVKAGCLRHSERAECDPEVSSQDTPAFVVALFRFACRCCCCGFALHTRLQSIVGVARVGPHHCSDCWGICLLIQGAAHSAL
eukprot:4325992-Amphidinium_carterae.1